MYSVDNTLQLYPAQAEGVRRFMERPDHRLVLAYGTGVGKTPTAIGCVITYLRTIKRRTYPRGAPRVLVICPAIVRRHWQREFLRWGGLDAHPIEMGRSRKSGTKAQLKARDAAYAADFQIVSYDLSCEVDAEDWDLVILDEVHHLSDCQSKQSRMVAALLRANPGVPVL